MNPNTVAYIAALLQVIPDLGIQSVHGIADLVNGTPQRQGETTDMYILRLGVDTDKLLADAESKDKQVEE